MPAEYPGDSETLEQYYIISVDFGHQGILSSAVPSEPEAPPL